MNSKARHGVPKKRSGRKLTTMNAITNDPRWTALVTRDKSADGSFFYSVATTGVFCRPSCGARTPLPKNVAFYRTTAEAERAGFRACKRCKPTASHSLAQEHASLVADLCRFIESSETTPKLEELATRSGLSPFHLHRIFKEVTGLTPRAYAAAARAKKMRSKLDRSSSVTAAVYDAGYSSSSRFYETSNAILGMTPKRWRSGGKGTSIQFAVGECSLGSILVAASDKGICAITMGDDPDALAKDLQDRFSEATLMPGDRAFEKTVATVIAFVDAPQKGLDLPLDLQGTAFQQRVWKALRSIPFGHTASYRDVAKLIGAPTSVRAVASACGGNPLAVVIPCHRVVTVSGDLAGYRWGIERKRLLLAAEQAK